MDKSLERQVKDAIFERLGELPDVASVSSSGRAQIVAEGDLPDGEPAVFVTFPSSRKIGASGFVCVLIPVYVEAKFRFEGDLDEMDMETVRDTLDAFEQQVEAAMREDPTWGGLAADTRWQERNFKATSEDVNAPEASVFLAYEVEIHHPTDDPCAAV